MTWLTVISKEQINPPKYLQQDLTNPYYNSFSYPSLLFLYFFWFVILCKTFQQKSYNSSAEFSPVSLKSLYRKSIYMRHVAASQRCNEVTGERIFILHTVYLLFLVEV